MKKATCRHRGQVASLRLHQLNQRPTEYPGDDECPRGQFPIGDHHEQESGEHEVDRTVDGTREDRAIECCN